MGMAASQSRLLMLTARLSDLELSAQQIDNAKIQNSRLSQGAALQYTNALSAATGADGNVNSAATAAATAAYEATTSALQAQDKIYDMELKNIDTEHEALQTEIDSVKKVIDKNIERSFKIFQA